MAGVLRVRVTPADVGSRVSIRARIASAPGEPGHRDTVGRLLSWEDGVLRIERRDGSVRSVDADTVVGGRVLGPAPTRHDGGRARRTT